MTPMMSSSLMTTCCRRHNLVRIPGVPEDSVLKKTAYWNSKGFMNFRSKSNEISAASSVFDSFWWENLVKKWWNSAGFVDLHEKEMNSLGFIDLGWKEKLRNSLGVIDSLRVKDRWKSVGAVNFGEKVVKFHRSHFWIRTLRFRWFWTKSNKMRKFRQFRMKRCWNSYAQAQWSGAEPLSYMIRL